MTTIMVVDDMAVFREPIAASLKQKGYETMCAANGLEALQAIQKQTPDLILLDIAMPVMDGLSFLEALRQQSHHSDIPVFLLTAVSERDYVVRAGKLGVQGYLLKSQFSLDDLSGRIEKCLGEATEQSPTTVPEVDPEASPALKMAGTTSEAAAGFTISGGDEEQVSQALKSLTPLLLRSEVDARLEACGELHAFSPTVAKVLQLTRSDRGTIQQIAKAIKQDQGLAIKILKLANSVIYTRGDPVETVDKAVLRIGFDQIRQVVLNVSVIDKFCGSFGPGLDTGLFWEHSIACGLIASKIAKIRGEAEGEAAFTMGLVHDVGRVIYAQEFRQEFTEAQRIAGELRVPLELIETRLLLRNHAEGMDRLLHLWKFPKDLIDPVVYHHLSLGNIRRMAPRRLEEVATLVLANRLCHALLLGSSGNEAIYPTEEFCQALKIDDLILGRIEETIRSETDNLKLALLSHTNDVPWEDCREHIRNRITASFRPLFVSERPEFDAYRIFCDQVRETSGALPNVGIIHLTGSRERVRLTNVYAMAEMKSGASGLPLIVLSPAAKTLPEDCVLNGRQVWALPTPVTVDRLVEAINQSLESVGYHEARKTAS